MMANDQDEVQKRETLAKRDRHENKMGNRTPAQTCPKSIHKVQQTAHTAGDSSSQA